jgi:predicted RNA-binding Zn ribbon-like protein
MTNDPRRVRGGGKESPDGYIFELTGGDLSLDLANTVDNRPSEKRRDLLRSYDDLASWGRQAGAVSDTQARRLQQAAARRPEAARRVFRHALQLREAIFACFSPVARGPAIPPEALRILNAALPTALGHLRLAATKGQVAWAWDAEGTALDRVLWPVVRAAADLLTGGDLDRVRECAADSCAWLFLDTSRNRSRRWCDMSVCGNRDKARRFYRRQHSGG